MKKVPFYALLIVCLFVAAGCNKSGGGKTDGPVIATVNKAEITQGDFLREVSRIPEWARPQFQGNEGKDKFLDELIKRELIYQHALKMKLDKDTEYLDKVKEFEKMTLVSLVLKKEVEEKAVVDDAEVKAFYDQNADKFTIGTELKASHILVETEKEAKDILARIKKGESFSDLAKKFSKDRGSSDKGGDVGYFARGKMVPEFENAALSLKQGEVSEPVKTRFGYHIIKLTDIKQGTRANFEQSAESIHRQLLGEKRKKIFDEYVEKLKGELKVSKVEENLKSLALPWEESEEPQQTEAPKPSAK
ncbi:MAG TPA: peptidylprolyl isomerase [Nitrospiraceae bacterium]|nr:peptidylprolyl isomerase [Nitrospiraceae bacterium]